MFKAESGKLKLPSQIVKAEIKFSIPHFCFLNFQFLLFLWWTVGQPATKDR